MKNKITHEQIRNHFKDNFNANDVKYEDIRIITEYISQQEKQEKLLELYKELAYHTRPIIIDDKYVELQQKIKELEKELEK